MSARTFIALASVVSMLVIATAPSVDAQRRIIASFDAVVEEPTARQVQFEWAVRLDREDEDLSCTIDVDVDDPRNPDEFVTDCEETTSFDHTYEEPGTYRAALTARSAEGGSDRMIVTVVVG